MRGYREYTPQKHYVDLQNRILSALVYAPFGWLVSLVWLITAHFQGKSLSSFARFNIFQSIFISILIFIFNSVVGIFYSVIGIIPFLGNFIQNLIYYPLLCPLIMGYSLFNFALIVLYGYLIFYALTGRYGKVPYISDIVQQIV